MRKQDTVWHLGDFAFESTKERERGQNKMEHRTIGDALSEGFRQWKKGNPDWQTYLENPPSLNDPARARQRRQEIYETLADGPLMYLQRILNAARLPPHPNRGHWERFFIREGMTMAQHARGQYLPFHKEMEHALAHIFETMDKEFFDYKGADGLARVKNHVKTWFDTHIQQPAAEAFADRNRQQHKRA